MSASSTANETRQPEPDAPGRRGRVILLNGSSSSGKTTLSTTLQRVMPESWQHVALDQFRDGLPGRVRGLNSPPGTPGAQGLNIVPVERNGRAMTEIRFGAFGEAVLIGMRRSVRALALAGVDVIVDDLLFKPSYLHDYQAALTGIDTWFVGVRCPLPVVEAREAARPGRFPGTAASHFDVVHGHGLPYDLEVDTAAWSPRQCAEAVRDRLVDPPCAFANAVQPANADDAEEIA